MALGAQETGMREEILGKIRTALAGQREHEETGHGIRPAPDQSHNNGAAVEDLAEIVQRFETELKKVGGQFYAAENSQAACEYVLKLARSQGTRSAAGWDCPVIRDIGLVEALEDAGVEFIADNSADGGAEGFIKHALGAGLGISGVDYALADTGTLVVLSGPGHARSVSLVTPVHVALVKIEQLLPDLNDLFPLLKERGSLSSAIALITGPSRTADIEMTLVVGVHGPQQLHVVLLSQNS
jgi:L-lactate dehydrogenase complex protein LldG